jgi:hypothetical protein
MVLVEEEEEEEEEDAAAKGVCSGSTICHRRFQGWTLSIVFEKL